MKVTPADIPVVILCGGKGTRLKEETEHIPKPLVRIGERPMVWHIMKIYHAQGFRRFVLLLGYKGEKIKEYFANYSLYANNFTLTQNKQGTRIRLLSKPTEDWEITFLDTGFDTMTGGRVKQLLPYLGGEKSFMLTYGDGVANVNLKKLIEEHKKSKRDITVTGVPPLSRFGEIRMDIDGIPRFFEKPAITGTLINGGFFMVNTSILKELSDDPMLNFEMHVLPVFAKENRLNVVAHEGYWQCMDTVRDMEALNAEWATGQAPWKLWKT